MTDIVRHAVDTTGHTIEDLAGEVRHRVDDLLGLVHPRRHRRPVIAGVAVGLAVAVLVAVSVRRWRARRSAVAGSPSAQNPSPTGANGSDVRGSHDDEPAARAATAPSVDR